LHRDLAAHGIDLRDHGPNSTRVAECEARREALLLLVAFVLGFLFLLLDDRLDDEVVRAEQLHLGENLLLGALSDREHRDHRRDAEQNAERCQPGTHPVVRDRVERDPHRRQRVRAERRAELGQGIQTEWHATASSSCPEPREPESPVPPLPAPRCRR
jgi:hypothetical protein